MQGNFVLFVTFVFYDVFHVLSTEITYYTIFAQQGYLHHAGSYIFVCLHVEYNPTYFFTC